MPRSADGLLQMYRSVALEHSLAADNPLWPRYASGLVYGYGAPLFNYFPPLSYFPATWLHRLGLDYVGSWLLSMVLYTLAAAAGMVALGRQWTGSRLGGWMAALAYIYAPYFLFDSVTRGTSSELAALAALPFVLFCFTRLADYGRRRDFLLAVLAFTVFITLHTLITLHGTAMLALFCLFLSWRATDRRAVFIRLLLAGAAAFLLTAFYWMPALLETDAIKLDLITAQLGAIEVVGNLRPLSENLAQPHRADPTQLNQAIPISLGWAQIALAVTGVVLSFKAGNQRVRGLMLFLGALTLLMVYLNTPASATIWETLPLIGYTQFPWRLLGLASLALALMAGIGAWLLLEILPARPWRTVAMACISALVLLGAIPWTYTAYHDVFAVNDIGDVQEFERDSGQLALSSYAEYLPLHTDADQLDPQSLIDRFASSAIIARLSSSETLEILSQAWTGTSAQLTIASHQTQTLAFDWLYVPGWRAFIDGLEVDVFASASAGLVALDVPAGEFELRIALGATSVQTVALATSAIGLVGLIALLAIWRHFPQLAWDAPALASNEKRAVAVLILVSAAIFVFKVSVLDTQETVFKAARYGSVIEAPALANFANRLDLLELESPTGPITGHEASFRLYWRLHSTRLDQDFSSIIRMRDPAGHVVAEAGSFAPGGVATSNWLPGYYVEDVITLKIPPFTPPLDQAYTFDVSIFDAETLQSLNWINAAGNPEDVKFPLGSLRYRPSGGERQVMRESISAAFETVDTAVLIEAPGLPAAVTAGDELQFSWLWQKTGENASDRLGRLLWLDDAGNRAGVSNAAPLVQGYSFALWELGEVNRGYHSVIVPPVLLAGRYALALEVGDEQGIGAGEIVPLDTVMDVAVPPRRFELPKYAFEQTEEWDNGIVLHGYSVSDAGTLELVWGTERVLAESLRLFVHLVDENGMIVAQWDGVPQDWTRPTTSWLPGEYLTTRHAFDLAAGEYGLRVGWYLPTSGTRIGVRAGDSLRLDETLIVK